MKKISLFTLLLLCLLLLSGCWDKHELEDNTFAILLGLDRVEDEEVMITIAFPITQTQGGGTNESMDNGSGNYSMMSVQAPTVAQALHLFSTKLSGPLALYSVKTIVISQEIARSDMLRQVFSSWWHKEIRNTTSLFVCESTAAAFIKARIKDSPVDPLRKEELLLEQINHSAYHQPMQLLELLTALKSDSGDGIALYGGSDSESLVSGLAVFRGAKMIGVLDPLEAQTYAILTRSSEKKLLTVQDPLDPAHKIVAEILPAGKSKVNSALTDGVPVFHIDIPLQCRIESVQSGIDYTHAQNVAILTEHIQAVCTGNMENLMHKVQKEYHADIFKLGNQLIPLFPTLREWERFDWPEKYKDAQIRLSVTLVIEHSVLP